MFSDWTVEYLTSEQTDCVYLYIVDDINCLYVVMNQMLILYVVKMLCENLFVGVEIHFEYGKAIFFLYAIGFRRIFRQNVRRHTIPQFLMGITSIIIRW